MVLDVIKLVIVLLEWLYSCVKEMEVNIKIMVFEIFKSLVDFFGNVLWWFEEEGFGIVVRNLVCRVIELVVNFFLKLYNDEVLF